MTLTMTSPLDFACYSEKCAPPVGGSSPKPTGLLDKHFPGEVVTSLLPSSPFSLKGHKKGQYFDREAIKQAVLNGDSELVDPKTLSTPQQSVTRSGVEYYLTDRYDKTGDTYADRESDLNRIPVIYEGRTRSGDMYRAVISGNHRATAALIQGKDLRAIIVRGKTTHPNGEVT